VAQYLGDGVMAYFGWPEAHDNDAERAGRAGLAILDAISRLNEHPAHPKLSARIGIDSGTVVVGAGAGKDVDVFGDTPNIAARVQAAADGVPWSSPMQYIGWSPGCSWSKIAERRRSRAWNGRLSFTG
jgi:class 3 adenylate cyclase